MGEKMVRKYIILLVLIVMISTASGLPEIMNGFNLKYSKSKTKLNSCELCHISFTDVSNANPCGYCHTIQTLQKARYLNEFGKDIKNNLKLDRDNSLKKIERLDSDGDGIPNIDEIRGNSYPGDRLDNKTNIPK